MIKVITSKGTKERIKKILENDELFDSGLLFSDVIKETMALLGYNESDLAEKLTCSSPTIARYRSGLAFPMPTLRKQIYNILLNEIDVIFKNGKFPEREI